MHQVRRRCPSMYETLEVLKHLPSDIVREEFLIPQVQNCKGFERKFQKISLDKFQTYIVQVLRLDVTEEDMEREHRLGMLSIKT